MPNTNFLKVQESFVDIIPKILDPQYTKLAKNDFTNALNALINLDCDQAKEKPKKVYFAINCNSQEHKSFFIYHYLKNVYNKSKLFDLFGNYISENKTTLANEDIKKLISLGSHYFIMFDNEIKNTNNTLSNNDITTTASFLDFSASLLSISSIMEFETPGLIFQKNENTSFAITSGDPQRIDTLIFDIIKLTADVMQKFDTQNYTSETENLLNFFESLGKFGYELKIKEEFESTHYMIPEIASNTIKSKRFNNFSQNEQSHAGYTFLAAFNAGDENSISRDCVELLQLDKCTQPITPGIQLYQTIIKGEYSNQIPSFDEFKLVEIEIKKNNIIVLECNQFKYILNFLKNILETNNESEFDFKNLYLFAFKVLNHLNNDLKQKKQLDENFAQATKSLSTFLLSTVNKNNSSRLLTDQIHIITQFSQLYENIIPYALDFKDLTDKMTYDLCSMLSIKINNRDAIGSFYSDFISIIMNVNKVCNENSNVCNKLNTFRLSSKSLGKIYRKSKDYKINAVADANRLIKSVQDKLSPEDISKAVSFFFKEDIRQSEVSKKCKQLFNLTGCQPSNSINIPIQLENKFPNDEPVITSTGLPENSTTPKSSLNIYTNVNSTSSAPIITPSTIVITNDFDNTTEISVQFNNNTLAENATALNNSDLNMDTRSTVPSAMELAASAAHGALYGTINGITQYFANKYSRHSEQGSINAAVIIYSSMLMNAAIAATFPLMLSEIQRHINQDNDEEAQRIWDTMLYQAFPIFITSLSCSLGLQIINECTNLLTNSLIKKIAKNTIALSATAWSIIKNPWATATHIGTSIASSALTYSLLNRIAPLNKSHNLDVEINNKTFEMEELIEVKDESNKNESRTAIENKLSPEEIFFKEVEFTTAKKFTELKKHLTTVIDSVKNLQTNLSNQLHIDRLQNILDIPEHQLGLCYDLLDLKKFPEKFIKKYNECKNEKERRGIIRTNFDYFKTMIKTMYDKLLSDNIKSDNVEGDCLNFILCSIKETKTLKPAITDLITVIEENLGFIRGITKPLVSIHLPASSNKQENAFNAITKRNNSISYVNNSNRHTFCAGDKDIRFSIASSSGDSSDSAKSDGYGNSQFNNASRQEQATLLDTRVNRFFQPNQPINASYSTDADKVVLNQSNR